MSHQLRAALSFTQTRVTSCCVTISTKLRAVWRSCFEGQGTMSKLFGRKDPFDDPFFKQPFGGFFGGNLFDHPFFTRLFGDQPGPSKQITIEELNPEDDDGVKTSDGGKELIVQDPKKNANGKHNSFVYSRVAYGGLDGVHYACSESRMTGGDGVFLAEIKEEDNMVGESLHTISKGIRNKVMDMEHELQALRNQIREKCTISFKLQKELATNKRAEENKFRLYDINGSETIGSILRVQPCSDESVELSKCSIQWYRLSSECSRREPIVGANKFVYAPDPIDVGRVLQVDVLAHGHQKYDKSQCENERCAYGMISDLETMNLMPTAGMYNVIMVGYFREEKQSGMKLRQ